MKPTRIVWIWWAVAVLVLIIGLVGMFFRQTLYGYSLYKFSQWEEEALVGQSLGEMRRVMGDLKQPLEFCDIEGFRTRTGRQVGSNEHVLKFVKGKQYTWFNVGTAHNIGYVIVRVGPHGETVGEIVRAIEIDSL